MNIEDIEVGKLVYLNSGSPAMTVTAVDLDGDDLVSVAWLSEDGHPQEMTFPAACLKELVLEEPS